LAKLPGSSNSKSLSLLLDATEVPIASYALLNSSTGNAAVHDISITRNVDRSSAKLAEACATGEHFTKATLAVRKAGHLYLTIAMKDVRISSYQSGGRSGAKTPVEALTLNAATLSFAYAK
jgi:type VI secretion system secreted protein Hcp